MCGLSFWVKGTRCSRLIIVLRSYDYLKFILAISCSLSLLCTYVCVRVCVQEWEHDDQTLYFTNLPSQITAEVSLSLSYCPPLQYPPPPRRIIHKHTLTNNLNINLPLVCTFSSFPPLSLSLFLLSFSLSLPLSWCICVYAFSPLL